MGLFSFITKPIEKAVKQVIHKPLKAIPAAIATGGVSLFVPKVAKLVDPITSKFFDPKLIPAAVSLATGNVGGAVATLLPSGQPTGVQPMGLNVGGILSQVGQIFGQQTGQQFQTISGVANLASQFFPAPAAIGIRPPVAGVPAVIPKVPMIAGRMGAMVGRTFFQKFPNLATSMQQLRDRGFAVKRSQLWSLMKRFGPELLITGGLLTAASVSELMMAGPGHRSMNAANPKALRRAARRIKSFHKMCGTIDLLKSRGRKRSVGRCGTCRQSPCRC